MYGVDTKSVPVIHCGIVFGITVFGYAIWGTAEVLETWHKLADARMSRKRVQLSNLDRKKICQLAVEHGVNLSQDKLTVLLQNQLNNPAVVLMRLSKPHYCVMQGSSPKSGRCSWLAILNSAPDEMLLHMLVTKVSKRTVLRINQSCQPNTSAYFSSKRTVISYASFVDQPAVQVISRAVQEGCQDQI